MTLAFRFAAQSNVGLVRSKNDDSAYVGRYLAVLADGMGGHAGGNIASATAVLDLAPLDHPHHTDAALDLADEIQNANLLMTEIVNSSPDLAGMGTTLTALLLDGDQLQFAHIGDSRAYRLKDDVFEQVSLDHTFVQRLVDEGRLLPEQAKTHPHRNVIARVLGDSDASPEVDLATLEVSIGERWLLCSDGLTDVVSLSEIEEYVRNTSDLGKLADILVLKTLEGGSPDNVTVAMVDVIDEADAEDLPATVPGLSAGSSPVSAKDQQEGSGQPPSAALLRDDLAKRPHLLVGAAELATQTGQLPVVTQHSSAKRLQSAAQVKSDQETGANLEDDSEDTLSSEDEENIPVPKRRPWLMPALIGMLFLLVLVTGTVGYIWSQTRYYVGESNGKVAIYNGVSQDLGPIKLSHVQEASSLDLSVLPQNARQGVRNTYPARDLEHAQSIVENLKSMARAQNCSPSVSAPGGKKTPSPKPSPSASKTPSPSTSPGSAPGPSIDVTAPVECGE